MSRVDQARREAEVSGGEPPDLGKRVRELRKAQGWTLAEAADRAGLARSTLSKIENSQMSPTYDAVKKLAKGLEISVPQLFTPTPADGAAGTAATITRAGEGDALTTTTYEHELMAKDRPEKTMLPYRARIRARSFEDFDGWVRHEGQEVLYVLTGIVRLFLEGNDPIDLRRGDSAYYDARTGHNVISISEDDATVLWVTSVP